MKKTLWLLVMIASLVGCKKLDELTQFEVVYHSEAVIPATIPLQSPVDIPLPPVTTNTQQTFENHNTHKDLIEEIKLREVDLKITDPVNSDFSFLEDIEIYMSADGLPEIKIAWKYDIPDSVGNELELETTDEELKEYLKADSFDLRVRVTVDELITRDHTVDVKTVFFVNAKVLGI
ncbi:MAG: hypothetical protein GXO27_06585 [Chlorobi bacterium]|nr:hypothetical protein [Chlorobiota bacterium]